MIIALDSYYKYDICNTSLVLFNSVEDDTPIYTDTIYTNVTSEYIPGQFYKRELPGIIQILNKFKNEHNDWWNDVALIILDSFIMLKAEGKIWEGLGQHLKNDYLKDDNKFIIGVAKTNFGECNEISEIVYRGESKTPLYVQSINSNYVAALIIKQMHGKYRIPTMLKLVDSLSRKF